jgi:hypothetical protein
MKEREKGYLGVATLHDGASYRGPVLLSQLWRDYGVRWREGGGQRKKHLMNGEPGDAGWPAGR